MDFFLEKNKQACLFIKELRVGTQILMLANADNYEILKELVKNSEI